MNFSDAPHSACQATWWRGAGTALAGLLVLVFLVYILGATTACDPGPQKPPDVILIVIDTLRADHLGAYGYHRDTSPRLDALAAAGTLFEQASSTAAYTRPSTASILTGYYPSVHGAITHADKLSEKIPTLAGRLKARGYRTLGIIRNGNVGKRYGLGRGFDDYIRVDKKFWRELKESRGENPVRYRYMVSDRLLADEATQILEQIHTDRNAGDSSPFFLYLHLVDPHDPYTPPRDGRSFLEAPLAEALAGFYRQPSAMERSESSVLRQLTTGELPLDESTLEQVIALYDGEIASSDHEVGRVLDRLAALDLAENTLVVVTADHGEEFFERGNSGHGHSHYEEQLHVPLIFHGAEVKSQRIEEPVSLIDITPTLLDFAGLDIEGLPGRSLRHALAGGRFEPRPTYSEGLLNIRGGQDPVFFRSIRDEDQKLTLDFLNHRKRLFDLSNDPGERRERFGDRLENDRRLYELLLARHHENLESPFLEIADTASFDSEAEAELRALGYVGSAKDSAFTDSFFRRPLKSLDLDTRGFMGVEVEGANYSSTIDFTNDLEVDGRLDEQLLYGWRPGKGLSLMRREAGVRLKRVAHESWRFSGRARTIETSLGEAISLEIAVDGVLQATIELTRAEPFEISGKLPVDHRGFTRFDLTCRPLAGTQAGPYEFCLVPQRISLEHSPP